MERDHSSPGAMSGRGIVIPGGGRYATCLWVLIHRLRDLGCTLPIEVWRLGEQEYDAVLEDQLAPRDVSFIDSFEIRNRFPHQDLNGWSLKPYAILHSRFKEVLLIDADNVPVRDPAFLLDTEEFKEHGALFWPDYWRTDAHHSYWSVMEVAYRDEPEFESGQIAVDKARCIEALRLANWLCERGNSYYWRHCHGDKDCFRAAWHRTNTGFAMPTRPVGTLSDLSMLQYDFEGERLFQHRHMAKWTILSNPSIPDFWHEEDCFQLIARLRKERLTQWFDLGVEDWRTTDSLAGKKYCYTRCGYDHRHMWFQADALIGEGNAALERMYCCKNGELLLVDECGGVTARLSSVQGLWVGRWLHHEKMPVVIHPIE